MPRDHHVRCHATGVTGGTRRTGRGARERLAHCLLRSPWPCLSAGRVEGDRGTDERLERARVDRLSFMDVDCAPCVPLEARVEELARVLQRSPFGERELYDGLVRLASADDSVVRPRWSTRVRRLHPLHFLDDVRVCLPDELAHPAQGLPAPVPELGDPLVNPLRYRLALVGVRLFHVLLPKLSVFLRDVARASRGQAFS